jgi:hypothetical protein
MYAERNITGMTEHFIQHCSAARSCGLNFCDIHVSILVDTQVSFAWNGFNNAMISNLGMVLRNILSKKSLVNYKVGVFGCKVRNQGAS